MAEAPTELRIHLQDPYTHPKVPGVPSPTQVSHVCPSVRPATDCRCRREDETKDPKQPSTSNFLLNDSLLRPAKNRQMMDFSSFRTEQCPSEHSPLPLSLSSTETSLGTEPSLQKSTASALGNAHSNFGHFAMKHFSWKPPPEPGGRILLPAPPPAEWISLDVSGRLPGP